MRRQYTEQMDRVQAPPPLVEETRARMRAEQQRLAQQGNAVPPDEIPISAEGQGLRAVEGGLRRRRWPVVAAAGLLLAACLAGGGAWALRPIQTALPQGSHTQSVRLRDGELFFSQEESAGRTPLFSVADPARREVTREAFLLQAPEVRLLEPKDFAESGFRGWLWHDGLPLLGGQDDGAPSQTPARARAEIDYEDGQGGQVALTADTGEGTALVANSVVAGQPVYTRYDAAQDTYLARFELDGICYELTGRGIEQKAFVKLLLDFFS